MAELRIFTTNLFVLSLIIFSFMTAIALFQIQNGAQDSINNDSRIAPLYRGLNEVLNQSQQQVEEQQEAFQKETPLAVFTLVYKSLIGFGKIITTQFSTVLSIIFSTSFTIFGVPAIVITSLTSLIIITLIFLVSRYLRIGQ